MIEIVGMAYKSQAYFDFMRQQARRHAPRTMFRAVLNDPTDELLAYVRSRSWPFPIDIYRDPDPNAYYLNRVYRCWNYCVESSLADYVCLINR